MDSEWEVLPNNTWSNLGSHTSPCPPVSGCTDSTATNYGSEANVNQISSSDSSSSCYYNPGCTDSSAFNYDASYDFDDGSCCLIAGCTDSSAFNYSTDACYDDDSCIAVSLGCIDNTAFNYCLLYTSPSPRDATLSRMPSSA